MTAEMDLVAEAIAAFDQLENGRIDAAHARMQAVREAQRLRLEDLENSRLEFSYLLDELEEAAMDRISLSSTRKVLEGAKPYVRDESQNWTLRVYAEDPLS